jgi:hypothetical protein
MLGAVAFIALACVALVRCNYIWASSIFTTTLAVISFAVLAAVFRRGAKQAFWIGFALFGWGYLWMAHWPPDDAMMFGPNDQSRWRLQNEGHEPLATTQLLNYFYMHWLPTIRPYPAPVPAPAPQGFGGGGGYGGAGFGGGAFGQSAGGGAFGQATGGMGGAGGSAIAIVVPTPAAAPATVDYPALNEFMRVGHSLFVIVLAFVGGMIAVQLYRSREQGEPAKREPLTSV